MTKQPKTAPIDVKSSFWTDDLDAAREHYLSIGAEHSRVVLRGSEFGLGYHSRQLDSKTFSGITALKGLQHVRAGHGLNTVMLHLPLDHRATYRVGRKTFESAPDRGFILPPHHIYSRTGGTGSSFALMVELEALVLALDESWTGRTRHNFFHPMELHFPDDLLAVVRNEVIAIHANASDLAKRRNLEIQGPYGHALLAKVAQALATQRGLRPLSGKRKVRILALEQWIDAKLGEDLSVEAMAHRFGVSTHTLTRTTLAARQMTPMQLLNARRMTAVNRAFRHRQFISVSEAAHEMGFSHLGRFSVTYREAFGEKPSETLRRAKEE